MTFGSTVICLSSGGGGTCAVAHSSIIVASISTSALPSLVFPIEANNLFISPLGIGVITIVSPLYFTCSSFDHKITAAACDS